MEDETFECAHHEPVVPGAPWAIIAVMGVTGSGKSTFIRTVSGDDTVVVGDGMASCTSDLKAYSFYYNGCNISLVDSPGFNDTFRSEADVLQDIATWLRETYAKHNKLTGIVYLHGINHVRMEGSALRNLRVFRELCGPEPLKNVMLATTFWGHVHTHVGEAREDELRSKAEFWGKMIDRGSRMAKFDGLQSGLDIISELVGLEPQPLQIQREMVDDDISLIETAAGQVVNEELAKLEAQHQLDRKNMQREMEEALQKRDLELQDILTAEQERVDQELAKVQRQQGQLKADRRAEHRRMQNEFDNQLWELQSHASNLERRLTVRDDERQQEQAEYNRRIQLLEKQYNEEATQRWNEMNVDEIIARVRVEESKLRVDEREVLEAEIEKFKVATADEPNKVAGKWKSGAKKAGNVFLMGLKMALPITTMFTLGFPIESGGLESLIDQFMN